MPEPSEEVSADEEELQSLVGSDPGRCEIAACRNFHLDERGPLVMTDKTRYKICTDHFQSIYLIIGQQMMDAHDVLFPDGHEGEEDPHPSDDDWDEDEWYSDTIEDGYVLMELEDDS
jgi:hypothetical protein